EAHKQSLENAIKNKVGAATLIAMIADWADKPSEGGAQNKVLASSPENQLLALLQKEKDFLESYGPNHPKVLELRREILVLQDSMSGPHINWAKLLEESGKKDQASLMKLVAGYLQSLELTLKGIVAEEEQLGEHFKAH